MKPWWRRQTLNPHYWVFLLQKDPRLMGLLIRDRHQEPGRMWGGDLSTSTDSRSHTSRLSLSSSSWWTWDYQSSWWYSYSRSSIWWLVAIRVASWAQPSLVLPGGTNNLQDQAGETVMLVNHNRHYLLLPQTRWTKTVILSLKSQVIYSDLYCVWLSPTSGL